MSYYEPGHAFGIRYDKENLPTESNIVKDIREMLRLYELVTQLGGTQELETDGHSIAEPDQHYLANITLEEKRRLRFHFRIERNPKLAKLAKEFHGYRCQVCGFSFEEAYGRLGNGYIEAHHLTLLSELPPNKPVKLSPRDDFVVICANCHRMIHRQIPLLEFSEFQRLYKNISDGDN